MDLQYGNTAAQIQGRQHYRGGRLGGGSEEASNTAEEEPRRCLGARERWREASGGGAASGVILSVGCATWEKGRMKIGR